jgi:hypothetical protein
MSNLQDFQAWFVDRGGHLIQVVPVLAETETMRPCERGAIAMEIDASNFWVRLRPLSCTAQ